MAEFDRMRAKVLAMLASREWRAARKAEDPTMVRHIPQLVRINKLGLLTFDSQAGRKDRAYAERAYCFGFVRDRDAARAENGMKRKPGRFYAIPGVSVYVRSTANRVTAPSRSCSVSVAARDSSASTSASRGPSKSSSRGYCGLFVPPHPAWAHPSGMPRHSQVAPGIRW